MHICFLRIESLVSAPKGRVQEGAAHTPFPELTRPGAVISRRPWASISPYFQSEVFTQSRHFPLK
jgi:hypothetical protein